MTHATYERFDPSSPQGVNARAVKIAAVVVIGLWCGVVLAGAGQRSDTRCSLVWSNELGLVWVMEASP